MKTVLLAIISLFIIAGCSSKPTTANTSKDASNDTKSAQVTYNKDKPISYAEYKKWREANDLGAKSYAEYKKWEINQRKWKLKNER